MTSLRGEQRRGQLLDAVVRLLGRGGITAVSHRSLADEAQVPLGSTTYYFASKDEIITEGFRHAATQEVAALQARLDGLAGQDLSTQQWTDLLVAWLQSDLTGDERARRTALYQLQLEAAHREDLRRVYESWTLAALRLAERMLTVGARPPETVDVALLVAALDGLRFNQLASQGSGVHPQVVPLIVERLFVLLRRPPH